MGGANLEVFKFGMYIAFPIYMMYYFGTNLDNRFSVPDFWPKPEQTHKIPFEREEQRAELERMKARRLQARARRLALESQGIDTEHTEHQRAQLANPRPDILQATTVVHPEKSQMSRDAREGSWGAFFGWTK